MRIYVVIGFAMSVMSAMPGCGSPPRPSPPTSTACETPSCRLNNYRTRAPITELRKPARGEIACGKLQPRLSCKPLFWCRASVSVHSRGLESTADTTWIARSLGRAVDAAKTALTFNTSQAHREADRRIPSSVARVALRRVVTNPKLSGDNPDRSKQTATCTLVNLDTCAGRVGYRCTAEGLPYLFDDQSGPVDGIYAFESVLDGKPILRGLISNSAVVELKRGQSEALSGPGPGPETADRQRRTAGRE